MKAFIVFLVILIPACMLGQELDSATVIGKVDSLFKLSEEFIKKKAFEDALASTEMAEKLIVENLGKKNLAYANCQDVFGKVWWRSKNNERAEEYYSRALAIKKGVMGEESAEYASSVANLAFWYYKYLGNYDKAEPLVKKSADIRARVLGKSDPNYATSIFLLAVINRRLNRFEESEKLFQEVLRIWEKTIGFDDPSYIGGLLNLGILYYRMGSYEKAESIYLHALSITERTAGKENINYANNLEMLALLYKQMGNYDKAESLYIEAVDILIRIRGEGNSDLGISLNNLGQFYLRIGDNEKAEYYYLESKAITERVFGKDHTEYGTVLNNLGSLYLRNGNFPKAEAHFREVQAIWEKKYGKEHYLYALSQNNLGFVYEKLRDYKMAESLFLKSLNIRKRVLDKLHPSLGQSLDHLANLYWKIGDNEKAADFFEEEIDLYQSRVLQAVNHLSERELDKYIKGDLFRTASLFSFAQTLHKNDFGISRTCFDNNLFYKGFLLNASSQIKNLALSDSSSLETLNSLKSYERRLATEYSKPLNKQRNVTLLEEKANVLEKELALSIAGYGEIIRQVSWKEVQQMLGPNEAVVEFVHYDLFRPESTDSIMYAALVLRSEDEGPILISLFEEKQLQKLLEQKGKTRKNFINSLYSHSEKQKDGNNLYELIWKPLEKYLKNIHTIYNSPSGLFHRINLSAIYTPQGNTIQDQYKIVNLTSTRNLVIQPPISVYQPAPSLVVGGISFDIDTTVLASNKSKPTEFQDLDAEILLSYSGRSERYGTWRPLKGTDQEADSIAQLLQNHGEKVVKLKGSEANEPSIKKAGSQKTSPRILHIATHGYFFPDPTPQPPEGGDHSTSPLSSQEREPGGEVPFKISDHPMIRSGLILAGGNYAWQNGKAPKGTEDGILTAYEISQLNLRNTELAVLSACETGLGDIKGNEGVYGLQRAFKIAGVQHLIMSLWRVPDEQSKELMIRFYQNWLEEEMELTDAFRAAQQWMKGRYPEEPHYWAGFVLVQ